MSSIAEAMVASGLLFSPSHAGGVPPVLQARGSFVFVEGVTERSLLTDVNADDLADVVLRIDFPLGVRVFLSDGDGTFSGPISSSAFSDEAFGFALGDLNGDAFADAVVGNPNFDSVNIAVLNGVGNGSFASCCSLQNGSSAFPLVAVGDVTGDTQGDIVSNTFVSLSVLPGTGANTFGPSIISGSAGTVGDPLLADLDGDKDLDVVQVSDSLNSNNANSTVRVNHNSGTGQFSSVQSFSVPARVGSGFFVPNYALAHLDDDGLLDLALFGTRGTNSGAGGLFLCRNVGGTFQQMYHQTNAQIGLNTESIAVGDFNGDGLDDVVVVRGSNSEIRVSAGAFNFNAVVPVVGPTQGDAALVNQFVGSALPDLIIIQAPISPDETYFIYENVTPTPAMPGDVNGDGTVNVDDLLAVITAWGRCAAPPAACNADLNDSGMVDVDDLLMVITNWSV